MEELQAFISTVGFPIACTAYMMVFMQKSLKNIEILLARLTDAIQHEKDK